MCIHGSMAVAWESLNLEFIGREQSIKEGEKSIAQLGTISSCNDASCPKGHHYQVLPLMVCAACH